MLSVMIFYSPNIYADNLDVLIQVGRNQADIARAYDEQTRNFGKVNKAIGSGSIKEGVSKDFVRRYGEPVIISRDNEKNREKWAYMPAGSTFFKGIKIYLFFRDKDGILEEISMRK